ncbi:MAG: I78 family peptidase inhibitor [Candidatus Sphingomonas phytovorans]|nr:I78 family peptidase inhibitor [Sphingomonas sp.]WEK02177.1 MAG: I78 family peptidase inhibitor [Sphingomonas sp.]
MALLGAASLLAGCQSTGERLIAQAARNDTCGAKQLRYFVGRKADQATRDTIEQHVTNARQLRWIVPGEDILADLNTGRINVLLDESGTIKGVGCY